MPTLSIIVPVYNKVKYLDACINSILKQTFADFELILVNDGSTDGSAEKCDFLKAHDQRILVAHQTNSGVSAARNHGTQLATGKYIGFIDADDTIQEDMYQILVNNALEYNADVSICSLHITQNENYKDQQPVKPALLSRADALKGLLNGQLNWSANNKIYNAEIARNTRFEGSMNEDLWFCFNALTLVNKNVAFADAKKYNYIKRDNSVSLSGFNSRHLESIKVSANILKTVNEAFPDHVDEATTLDLISNLSVLNLMILSKSQAGANYLKVAANLKGHRQFLSKSLNFNKKQKYAIKLFYFSPAVYGVFLRLYCKLFVTEAASKVL